MEQPPSFNELAAELWDSIRALNILRIDLETNGYGFASETTCRAARDLDAAMTRMANCAIRLQEVE